MPDRSNLPASDGGASGDGELATVPKQTPNRLSRDDGELREAIEAEIHKLRAIEPSNEAGPMTKQLARATADRLQAALVEGDD